MSIANLAACAAYLYLSIGLVYGTAGALRAGKTVILALAAAAIVLGYRFVVFLITFYVT